MKGNVWRVERIEREAGFQPWFDVTIRIVPENASEYPTFTVDEPVIVIKESAIVKVLKKEFNVSVMKEVPGKQWDGTLTSRKAVWIDDIQTLKEE